MTNSVENKIEGAIRVLSAGVEGGGVTFYARRKNITQTEEAVWAFWREWSSMSLDDNDDEEWLYGRTEETPDLETLITDSLFRLYPSYVAPQWAAYFAERLRRFEAVALEHEQQRLPRWREKVKGALLHESAS